MYRKVPIDLLEGSKQGSIISWIALLVIVTLFVLETKDFFTNSIQTDLALDTNKDKLLRVNFNISKYTMLSVSVDVHVLCIYLLIYFFLLSSHFYHHYLLYIT